MKIEIELKGLLGLLWFFVLSTPATILMVKVSKYLYYNEFQTWWLSLIWAFVIPVTSLVIFTRRK